MEKPKWIIHERLSWECEGKGIQTPISSFPNGSARGINHNTQALFDEHECEAIKYN